jgi:hypothetical protein
MNSLQGGNDSLSLILSDGEIEKDSSLPSSNSQEIDIAFEKKGELLFSFNIFLCFKKNLKKKQHDQKFYRRRQNRFLIFYIHF